MSLLIRVLRTAFLVVTVLAIAWLAFGSCRREVISTSRPQMLEWLTRHFPSLDPSALVLRSVRRRSGIDSWSVLQFSVPPSELTRAIENSVFKEVTPLDLKSGRPGWTVNRLLHRDEREFVSWERGKCRLFAAMDTNSTVVYLVSESAGSNAVMMVIRH